MIDREKVTKSINADLLLAEFARGEIVLVVHSWWSRRGCVPSPQYDPTTDFESYAHRCMNCGSVSYFPIGAEDDYCRRCGAKMDLKTDH